jgi:hypothetical protein
LDYSKTTNLDPGSVTKEAIVLYDIERELVSHQYYTAAIVCSSMGTAQSIDTSREFIESGMRAETPWTVTKPDKRSKEEVMLELYNKLLKNKKEPKDGLVTV